MKRLALCLTGLGVAVLLGAGSAVANPGTAKILIRHQLRGCHSWSVDGKAFRATQTVHLARGGTISFVNDDVMPQKLVQKGGPAAQFAGRPNMSHMGASLKVTFPKAGVYRFVTKAGEDYPSAKGLETTGEDNVLTLEVVVA